MIQTQLPIIKLQNYLQALIVLKLLSPTQFSLVNDLLSEVMHVKDSLKYSHGVDPEGYFFVAYPYSLITLETLVDSIPKDSFSKDVLDKINNLLSNVIESWEELMVKVNGLK